MTTSNPPRVGDKVVYVPRVFGNAPLREEWAIRTRESSLVIDGPHPASGSDTYIMRRLDSSDEWIATADKLRVVERATYTPVDDN